ncbi:hypothetical protein LT337_07260 [Mycolicibacterium fortuitum]|nr:hypothetical protein LT337_07260 [Mycolicibacterium fortuitum]
MPTIGNSANFSSHWEAKDADFEQSAIHVPATRGNPFLIGVEHGGTVKIGRRSPSGKLSYLLVHRSDVNNVANALIDLVKGLE